MGLEAPVGAAVHTGGGESGEAQLVLACGDILGDLLQISKGLDVVGGVTSLLQQSGVGDQTIGLDNIGDTIDSTVLFQSEVVAGQLAVHGGAAQVIAVILPVGKTHGAVHLEQGGGVGLGHVGHQGLLVSTGSGGHHGDGHTGLLGVSLGQILPILILFGLEVQVIHLAGSSGVITGTLCVVASAAAGDQRQRHHKSQDQCKKLFHVD